MTIEMIQYIKEMFDLTEEEAVAVAEQFAD